MDEKLVKLYGELRFKKNEIENHKELLHYEFVSQHWTKKWLKAMDVMIILMIVFNIFAVSITGFVVTKEKQAVIKQIEEETGKQVEVEYVELNPFQAEAHDLKQADIHNPAVMDQLMDVIGMIFLQSILYAVLIFTYIRFRNGVFDKRNLFLAFSLISLYFIILTKDFVWDLSLIVGGAVF